MGAKFESSPFRPKQRRGTSRHQGPRLCFYILGETDHNVGLDQLQAFTDAWLGYYGQSDEEEVESVRRHLQDLLARAHRDGGGEIAPLEEEAGGDTAPPGTDSSRTTPTTRTDGDSAFASAST